MHNETTFSGSELSLLFSFLAVAASALISSIELFGGSDFLVLFLSMEGMALLGSMMVTSIFMPPPQGFNRLEWLFSAHPKTVKVICRQPVFYAALLCLIAADVLS
ncbi:MAG: hypothetical protein ACRD1R_14780 [Acidobacteriota bacterium]